MHVRQVCVASGGQFPGDGEGGGTISYEGQIRADGLDAVLVASRGLDAQWKFTVREVDDDLAILAFPEGATIAGQVWAGLDGPSLATLTGEWIDIDLGTGQLDLSSETSAELEPGDYNCRITVTVDDTEVELHSGRLRITAAPGQVEPDPGLLYCSEEELIAIEPSLYDQRSSDTGTGSYVDAIRRASRWADGVARVRAARLATSFGWRRDAFGYPLYSYAGSEAGAAIDDALADGLLDTSDDRFREAVARYAISLIAGGDRTAASRSQERMHAVTLMIGVVLALDLDDDGIFEVKLYP